MSSFVWNGPLMRSKSANWISDAVARGASARRFSQLAAAHVLLEP